MKKLALITLFIFSCLSMNYAVSGNIAFSVEEPASNADMTGISNIRGWAVSTAGIDRIELSINGVYKTDIPYGGTRGDVEKNYPSYPDSRYSGFSMAYGYSLLAQGKNNFLIKAIDNDGASKTITRSFDVAKFQKPYFPENAPFSIDESIRLYLGDDIVLPNVNMLGKRFAVIMGWDKDKQNVTIKDTFPAGYSRSSHDGAWSGSLVSDTISNGQQPCAGGYMEVTLSNGKMYGDALSGWGEFWDISGSVSSNGSVSGQAKLDKYIAGTFSGSVSSDVMGGVWGDSSGCSGRWWAAKN